MAHIFNHSHPGMNVNDVYVIVFRDFENQAYIVVKALTADARITLESYRDINATDGFTPGSSTNYVFPVAGETRRINIPESGLLHDQVTRILITKGRVALDVTSPSVCRVYVEQPASPPRIASED